jgi:hypothetical protein
MEKDNEMIHIYFSIDIARDGITDSLVRITKFNHSTKDRQDQPHIFSNRANYIQKNDSDFIAKQSEINIAQGNAFFKETYENYKSQGYVEKPTLFDSLQNSINKVREQFSNHNDSNKPDIK